MNEKSLAFEPLAGSALIDGSKLMTESLVQAGADVFVGYPITPANLVYIYAKRRFETFMAAPDEISTLQWMTGYATTGKIPVTATSFPGYALMIESINMAYMMEMPMVIILIQRLGPSTGTATCGAQGDLNVINGTISGGYPLPCFAVSNYQDCWDIPPKALKTAVELRTPVVILTSKEEMMTQQSFDLGQLDAIEPLSKKWFSGDEAYLPYKPGKNLVPEFLPVSDTKHQVRVTASTHNQKGLIESTSEEALGNSRRLRDKIIQNLDEHTYYDYYGMDGAKNLVITYGITASAGHEAVKKLNEQNVKTSLLVAKTLSPLPDVYFKICDRYENIVVAEENLDGNLRKAMFGSREYPNISGVNVIGRMIEPGEIMEEVKRYE